MAAQLTKTAELGVSVAVEGCAGVCRRAGAACGRVVKIRSLQCLFAAPAGGVQEAAGPRTPAEIIDPGRSGGRVDAIERAPKVQRALHSWRLTSTPW